MKGFTVLLMGMSMLFFAPLVLADEKEGHVCFRSLDTNQDDQVTMEEFERVYKEAADRFKAADADKDGTLTHDEYHKSLGHGSS